jgi:hypothetical protein
MRSIRVAPRRVAYDTDRIDTRYDRGERVGEYLVDHRFRSA